MGIVPPELTTKLTDHIACMKGIEKGGAPCVALRYTAEEGYRCSIYKQRSSACKDFNVLSKDSTPNPKCQELQLIAKQKKQQGLATKSQ